MPQSRNWYGRDWKQLRSNLVKLCLRYADDLLNDIKIEPFNMASLVEQFINNIEQDIAQMIPTDRLGLWEKALPLFADRQRLVEWLEKDRNALCGRKIDGGNPVQPRQALGRKLRQYFEQARREQLAVGHGVSANKIKTWERLDRISRNLAGKKATTQRCSEEHFDELAQLVKKNHPHDKNLPRKMNTIQDYFYRFSDECFERIDDRTSTLDKLYLQEAKEMLQGVGMAELSRCLNQLVGDDLEIIDMAFRLGIGKVQYRTVQDFLKTNGLTLAEYKIRQKTILKGLQHCLECSLHERVRGRG